VVVVIPARNEEDRVVACLRSVLRAVDRVDVRRSDIVLVADRCSDRTIALAAAELGDRGRVLDVDAGSVGDARRSGTAEALASVGSRLDRTWIASTDADTVVPADWIDRQLRHARSGTLAVAGIVELLDAPARLRARFDERYRALVEDTHPHVHAANLGVRADAYLATGGWTPLLSGEDQQLWRDLVQLDVHPAQDPQLTVATSARLRSRAPEGFAADLAALDSVTARANQLEMAAADGSPPLTQRT
jgi:glycosyltransferase involved in cell wall biosynthesis